MPFKPWIAQTTVLFIKFLVLIYDVISFPIYFIIDKPWNKWKLDRTVWAKLENEKDPYSCYVRHVQRERSYVDDIRTMDELFRNAVSKFGPRKCFGVRQVLGEEEEKMKSGKTLKKLTLGDYTWLSYDEIAKKVENISNGLLSLGVRPKEPIILLAETRLEWNLTAQACFRINVPIATIYATLGEDGLVHGINETEVSYIVTSMELLPKLKKILPRLTNITHIIVMKSLKEPKQDDIPNGVKLIPFTDLEHGRKNEYEGKISPPEPEDLAVLMYTSGSTGVPKGVMITHKNAMTTIRGFFDILDNKESHKDIYVAFLPAAHIMELAAEQYMLALGTPIGFSSPQTLTDFSTGIKKGSKGDLKMLKPTLMAAVPLLLDRIRKSILQLAGKEGTFSRLMFDFAMSYKHFWSHLGFKTPMLDWKLLKTYRDFLGGQLRIVTSGSAPLSQETQRFIRSCLNVQLLQGYAATETTAVATCMKVNDYSIGTVGAPLSTCKLKLIDWEDGNYHVTDKPNPRGEIVVGGDCVTNGYFKRPELTKESFKEENGMRWFYTGDIGEVCPNGVIKIIDRKKDLVKLPFGEYVPLGKSEMELKTFPLVENICLVGGGLRNYIVALVSPNPFHLKLLAKELGKDSLSFEEMCNDEELNRKVAEQLKEHGKKSGLFGAQLPYKIKLCHEEWTPESGLVTAALKIRRKMIESRYKNEIDEMYAESMSNGVSTP